MAIANTMRVVKKTSPVCEDFKKATHHAT